MRIDLNTKMIVLIGEPLGFSFAARMQNAAYEAAGLNMIYFYCETGTEGLPRAIDAVRLMNFAGCAVTKPNKIEVLRYLDELDDLCAKMGSSNTVVKLPDGRLKGYNTDGEGFVRSLAETSDRPLAESTLFCLGAGGTGRSTASTAAYRGARRIFVADVDAAAAESLVHDINSRIAPVAETVDLRDDATLRERVSASDVVMNNTGVGMIGHEDETPLPADMLRAGQLCFDATYNPERTRFLREAEAVGCRVLNGVGMNIYQGAAQIKLWTGREAPIEAMRAEFAAVQRETRR